MKKEMWLIWKEFKTRRRYKIGELIYDGNEYQFKYINPELDSAIEVGFKNFPGFDDLSKTYVSKNLFANIETRLPNKVRPDYLEILNSYDLDSHSTEIEILEATKGRLVTDNYEFVKVFDKNKIEFDIAGTKHSSDVKRCKNLLLVNDKLDLIYDENNEFDENAIKVILNKNGRNYHLGYVPRYYAKELSQLLKDNIQYSAMVESINFESDISDEDISVLVKIIFK